MGISATMQKSIAIKNLKLMRKKISKLLTLVLFCLFLTGTTTSFAALSAEPTPGNDPNLILYYISNSWKILERSMNDCNAFSDPKTHITSILYLPAHFPMPPSVQKLQQRCHLTVKRLPTIIKKLGDIDGGKIQPPGLLYLPYPYIVPGGMFNEMYGWDSYFIIRGLIEDKKIKLAHGIVENFFFEIDHYGGTLNGNRTYYLTRTQLPFLAPIIRAVYEEDKAQNRASLAWLSRAIEYAIKDYNFWTHAPHLAGKTGLSRYYDLGEGPVSELDDSAKTYYSDVVRYFLTHPEISQPYLLHSPNSLQIRPSSSLFTISLCKKSMDKNKDCKLFKNVGLSDLFYKGDRAMRESGFDVSFRFGPFSADTLAYAPVDLNSLLYKAEIDLAWMSKQLNRNKEAVVWQKRAQIRSKKINEYLWNDKRGLYFDYNYMTQQQSENVYASAFYPLWAGLASTAQAKKVVDNLSLFEKPGGIVTSLQETGVQWDYPYGWAPIQLIAIEGLYEYGFADDANRISHKFLMMVLTNFMREKTIREKYNVVSCTSQTNIQVGYKLNVTGFGWTNGVFLVLIHKLPQQIVKTLFGVNQGYAKEPSKNKTLTK